MTFAGRRGSAFRLLGVAAALAAVMPAASARQVAPGPAAESDDARDAPRTPAASSGGAGDQARFDALVSEIGSLREDLDRLDRKERGILAELDRLAIEDALHSREAARLRELRRRAGLELEDSRRELEMALREAGLAEKALSRRLRDLYIHGKQREVRVLLAAARPVDLLRGVAYLDVMATRQAAAVSLLQDRRARAASLEEALAAQVVSLESLARRQEETGGLLARARERSAGLLRDVRQDAQAHRTAIGELTRAAALLEEAIVASQRGLPVAGGPVRIDPGALRGALAWPVSGVVAIPFGDITHPRFGTVTPHPGVDIETAPGAAVRAVLGGRVAFARRFAGYGNTVLLDHGERYLSVYARAAVLHVAEGDEVLPGQTIGLAAEASPDGGAPTIYFEWRHEGKTLDPARWLKRSSGPARSREGAR